MQSRPVVFRTGPAAGRQHELAENRDGRTPSRWILHDRSVLEDHRGITEARVRRERAALPLIESVRIFCPEGIEGGSHAKFQVFRQPIAAVN